MKYVIVPEEDLKQMKEELQRIRQMLSQITEDTKGVLDVKGACEFLSCSKRSLQHYRSTGELVFHQRGKMIWFLRSDLLNFLSKYRIKKGKTGVSP